MKAKGDPRLFDDSNPLYAPGMSIRPRLTMPDQRIWLPRPKDIKAGFRPKSMPIPNNATDAQAAKTCRKLQTELLRWRETGTTSEPLKHGSWSHLIKGYKTEELSPYHALSPRTRADYDGYMAFITKRIGKRTAANTSAKNLWKWYKYWLNCPKNLTIEQAREQGVRLSYVQAKHKLGMIRRLARMGVLMGFKDCKDIEDLFQALQRRMVGANVRKSFSTWQNVLDFVEVADADNRWSIGTATMMQFELAQRQGDIIGVWLETPKNFKGGITHLGKYWANGVTWSDFDDDWQITIVQNKRKGKAVQTYGLRDMPVLFERLQAVPKKNRVGPIIVSEVTELPYRYHNFIKHFRAIAKEAGWPDGLWSMDNRAGAATEADDAGATTKATQSLTMHSTESQASRYSRTNQEKAKKVTVLRQDFRKKTEGEQEG